MAISKYNALEHEGLEVVRKATDVAGVSPPQDDEKLSARKCERDSEAPQVVPRDSELPVALCHDKESAGLQVIHRTELEMPEVAPDTGPSLVRYPSLELPILAFDDIAPEVKGDSISSSYLDDERRSPSVEADASAAKARRKRCGLSKKWFIAVMVLITIVILMALAFAALFGIVPAVYTAQRQVVRFVTLNAPF
jgi:hypothetical protein